MPQFLTHAIIGLLLICIPAALLGTYVVTRRQTHLAGGITHASFGGLGLGYYLGANPIALAGLFAISGALGARWLARRNFARYDSAIALVWAFGMALGILFIFLTPGYVPELNTFLFGNVLTITRVDLWIYFGFSLVTLLVYLLLFRRIMAVSFDPAFARTRHLPVTAIDNLMTILVAIDIVLTIKMIGIMLLMSMISLPQLTAERLTTRYRPMMVLSLLFAIVGTLGGLWLAYIVDVPASAAIIILMVALYVIFLIPRPRLRR